MLQRRAAFWDVSSLKFCFSQPVEWNGMRALALLEVLVRSLFAYVVWLAHNLRASIAKIPDHCVAAMFVGMLRLHLCDVATAAHAQRHICEGAWTRMLTSAARDGI